MTSRRASTPRSTSASRTADARRDDSAQASGSSSLAWPPTSTFTISGLPRSVAAIASRIALEAGLMPSLAFAK
jgi:hypothetical protein